MSRKLKLFLSLLLLFLLTYGFSQTMENASRALVNHIEAGNFINVDNTDLDKITMLHWFSKEVQVYSESKSPLHFVIFDSVNGLTMYKDKSLMMQNESAHYPKYQASDYMTFYIIPEDYRDNRVDFYSEVKINQPADKTYKEIYFMGTNSAINRLIVLKESLHAISMFIFIFLIICKLLLSKRKERIFFLLIAFTCFMVDINFGILVFATVFYGYTDKIFKRKNRLLVFLFTLLLTYMITFYWHQQFSTYLLCLYLLSCYNYFRNKSEMSFVVSVSIAFLFMCSRVSYEFSFFRLFYDELYMNLLTLSILSLIIIQFRQDYSNEKTVKLDLLRGVSHDLRVPISTIHLNTELLEKNDYTAAFNRERLLTTIKSATRDLSDMTASLTAYMSKDGYVGGSYKSSLQLSIQHTLNYFRNNEKNISIISDLEEDEIFLP